MTSSDETRTTRLSAARLAALRALALRPRTIAEISERLRVRFGEDAASVVVDELRGQGLLDDAAFAAAWRSSRERHRPRGASLVARELVRRGVPRELASSAVAGMDDESLAFQAARSQLKRLDRVDDQAFTRRLAAYLGRRGFSASVIRQTVARARQERSQSRGAEPEREHASGVKWSEGPHPGE